MALPPHWLDDVFEGSGTADAVTKRLTDNPAFQDAIRKAMGAYSRQEEQFRRNPNLMAGSPAQNARLAFLEALGFELHDNETHG